MFGFRNPGLMRVPIEQALAGGSDNSDCRNRNLQKMFQLIGAGEQAGSGIPKIYQSWEQQHWRRPLIIEKPEPAQTIFELHMASLLSKDAIEKLDNQFGNSFRSLPNLERVILATAISEEAVDHKRIRAINSAHPADISKALHFLVQKKFLAQKGTGRGTIYYIKGNSNMIGLESSSIGLGFSSIGLESSSIGLEPNSIGLDEAHINEQELTIATAATNSRRLSSSEIQSIIYELCSIRPQPLEKLSILLHRSPVYLRNCHLNPMISSQKIQMLYADTPHHPHQAYIATKL